MWQEPIFDRTNADTLTARADQSNIDNHKGALNYQDLNRIEENFQYVVQHLFDNAMVVPHKLRNYTEVVLEYVQTGEVPEETEYTRVEYIESTGTQWIDTGFKPNQNTRVVMDVQILDASSNSALFGCRTGTKSKTYSMFFIAPSSLRSDYGGEQTSATLSNPTTRVTIDRNKNTTEFVGGTINNTAQAFQCEYNLTLLALNAAGTISLQSKVKLYACKIYDNETLVRDYIPVLDANDVACLYDKLNHVYYRNKGTGAFTSGPEVSVETEPVYGWIETKKTYTDWQEQNIPWLSEIDRIRQNFNNLIALFLRTLDLPTFSSNIYLMYSEVNDWERVSLVGKTMFDNMEKEYIYSGTIDCGGDRLL